MKSEINVLTTDQKTLVIREGKAMELREPLVVNISGDIDTVKSFVNKRYRKPLLTPGPNNEVVEVKQFESPANFQIMDKDKAVITFDKTNLSISLAVDPQDYYGPKVSGSLSISDELEPWGINDDKMFNRQELVDLIKFNKRFFTDAAVHDTVLKAFQNLSLTGNTQMQAGSDTRGNKNAIFDKKLDTSKIPTTFYLQMPIFKNQMVAKFLVEVCIDSSEHSVQFWFESVELAEIKDAFIEDVFNEQKELFTDFVIVNK